MTPTTKFQEEYSAKIPALTLLCNLGWSFLTPKQALAARDGKNNNVVLRDVLRKELEKRHFNYAGQEYPLSTKSIDYIINEICSPALNEGLTRANEKIYNHLIYGIPVNEFIDGKKFSPTIELIDWEQIHNNSFLFTEEFKVLRTNGLLPRSPDIVCFVNGIPLVVIEAKHPDGQLHKGSTLEEGISQNLRNQLNNEIPHLFAYSQLLLCIHGIDSRYGTQGTKSEFWAVWNEEMITDIEFYEIKNQTLSAQHKNAIFKERTADTQEWYEKLITGGELAVTAQDKIIISLLSPQRLLEIIRYFILFDKKAGKIIGRYPQVFGIKRLLEHISKKKQQNNREGGVIWHTTGSGKSFMMVFLSKALLMHDTLKNCRIVVITDRVDLETQLSNAFLSTGEFSDKKDKASAMATSGRSLAARIGHGTERFIFSLIQKFNSAAKLPECFNDNPNIIVLIDEGHRSQGGENHARMRHILPNATFVAFTGTPLLKQDKTTNKFGRIIHAYTMQQAVADKAVTPLLYEERKPDLDINDRAIDSWFDRITLGITDEQRTDLKKKFARKDQIYQAEDRIRLIALDIANHFSKNIMKEGLKAQLACDSKLTAIKYKQFLDETGLFATAVVMSPPGSREGNTEVDEALIPAVSKWWQENVGTQEESEYTEKVIERFKNNDDNLKMLIVVDKLLTGFDEPKNAVLYIDKPLKEHNLIQAVARVNRLHPSKQFGYLIDYRGILPELDTTIAKYQDLASRTQGGFDINDIAGLYHQMSTEYQRLPQLHDSLWLIFKAVKNKNDIEQLRQVLVPKMQEINGEMIDVNLKVRDDFYQALSEFTNCLSVALQSATFFEDTRFSEDDRKTYKKTLDLFTSLRQIAKLDAGETIQYNKYAEPIKKLLDKHVVGIEIRESTGVYEVAKMGIEPNPENWSENKIRNETDIIKTRVTRMIEQTLRDDPYAQEAFSKLLRQAIKEAEELFDHPFKQYMLFTAFEDKVVKRQLDDIPTSFNGNRHAQAYFGIFKKVMPSAFSGLNDAELQKWVRLAFTVDELVTTAVTENSINPQNIEAAIRTKLLPLLFLECKSIGTGVDQAKGMVEHIVQIIRVGWSSL